jgi:hypothetical protein
MSIGARGLTQRMGGIKLMLQRAASRESALPAHLGFSDIPVVEDVVYSQVVRVTAPCTFVNLGYYMQAEKSLPTTIVGLP